MEIPPALQYPVRKLLVGMLNDYPKEYQVFDSDSPWAYLLDCITKLNMSELNDGIFCWNSQ